MAKWEEIFNRRGRVFIKPQENIPKLARVFKKTGVKRILDIGCGTGRHTVYFAKRGFDVYGFDVSKTGIKHTKGWLKKEKLEAKIIFHDMAKRFPYKNNFFDAVIAVQVIHHNRLNKIRKTIKEIKRVLKKNGLIFISVQSPIAITGKKHKIIAPNTYIPLDGKERGLTHYCFTKEKIYKEFKGFEIKDVYLDSHMQFCIMGKKK